MGGGRLCLLHVCPRMYLCEGVVVVVVYLNSLCIQCMRMWRGGGGLYLLSVYSMYAYVGGGDLCLLYAHIEYTESRYRPPTPSHISTSRTDIE